MTDLTASTTADAHARLKREAGEYAVRFVESGMVVGPVSYTHLDVYKRQARNGAIFWGMGISQLSHGTASALGLIHLALLTGHIGSCLLYTSRCV